MLSRLTSWGREMTSALWSFCTPQVIALGVVLLTLMMLWPEKCRFARRLAGRLVELTWLYLPVFLVLPLACLADGLRECLRGDVKCCHGRGDTDDDSYDMMRGEATKQKQGSKETIAEKAKEGMRTRSRSRTKHLLEDPAETWLDLWWGLLLQRAQHSGPVFVKMGQWAATRRDLLPEEWCDQLGRLHDKTGTHPLSFTHKVLNESFPKSRPEGAWYKRLLLEPDSIGSGCIAQVYLGYLILDDKEDKGHKPPGCKPPPAPAPMAGCWNGLKSLARPCFHPHGTYTHIAKSKIESCIKVAVKVVHPQVKRAVDIDLKVLYMIASVADAMGLDGLGLSLMLRQFADFLQAQVDLRKEAENLRGFRERLGPSSAVDGPVIVPEVFDRWVTKDVLVMSYETGEPLSELLHARNNEMETERIAAWKSIVDTFWAMVFKYRFVHGDMHPGNLLWRRGPTGAVQVVLLDCGLVIDLQGEAGEDLTRMVKAFLTKTEEETAELLVQLSERVGGKPEDVIDKDGFVHGIAGLIKESNSVGFKLSKLNAGALMGRSLLLGRRHRVRFDARFVNLMVAMVVLQGVAMELYGDGDILKRMLPYVLGATWKTLLKGTSGNSASRYLPKQEPESEPSDD